MDQATNVAGLPALIDSAAQRLAGARSAAEILDARDIAAVVYDTAKRAARLAKAKGAHDDIIARTHRAQADALEIEAGAKRRLADEYDAAQERGEINQHGGDRKTIKFENSKLETLSPGQIHEARTIRDAETIQPGIVARAIKAAVDAGEEPTRAKVRRAVLHTVRPDAPPARIVNGKAAIIGRVKDAIAILSGLPPAQEIIEWMRGRDEALIVGENLPAAARWLAAFADLWPEEGADAEAAE